MYLSLKKNKQGLKESIAHVPAMAKMFLSVNLDRYYDRYNKKETENAIVKASIYYSANV